MLDAGTRSLNRGFLISAARAFGGAILFSLPIMMTMEMWSLGAFMHRGRLAILLLLLIPLLVRLSYRVGFEPTFDWRNDVVDAFVALAIGFLSAIVFLPLFGVLDLNASFDTWIGMVTLQAVPSSMGAMLAQAQLGRTPEEEEEEALKDKSATYWDELFLMTAGALFLAFSVAPTEEIILIAHKMTPLHALALMTLSLLLMHAFVYAVEFRGQETPPEGSTLVSLTLRYTVTGYTLALLISVFVLWTFGRTDGLALFPLLFVTVVLAFPAAVGAAAARLIL